MAIRGMLLDVDGTLVLSNEAQAQAWVDAFKTQGRDVPIEKVRPLIGMGGDKVMPELAPGLNDKDGDGKEIADARKDLMLTKLGPTLKPTPGARSCGACNRRGSRSSWRVRPVARKWRHCSR